MKFDDLVRVRHMVDASQTALDFMKEESRESLEEDVKLSFAVVRALEIVGEAASKLTAEFKHEHSEISWGDIIGMRNRLIHAYFEIDYDVVWKTVTLDLPFLLSQLVSILPADSGDEVPDEESE